MQMRVQGQGTHQTGVRIRLECTMLTTPGIAVTIALSCLTSPAVDRPCLPPRQPRLRSARKCARHERQLSHAEYRRASTCGTATVVMLRLRPTSACAPLSPSPNRRPKQRRFTVTKIVALSQDLIFSIVANGWT